MTRLCLFVTLFSLVISTYGGCSNVLGHVSEKLPRAVSQPIQYEIELLIVADYSFYKSWYDKTSNTSSNSTRTTQAKHMLKEYVGALINGANVVYTSLEPYNIYIRIKLVDIYIATTPAESPWTETIKFPGPQRDRIESTEVLKLFQPGSVKLQATIPHDHAMILTSLDLANKANFSAMAGYAYMDAECQAKSVSVVEDNEDFYTAQLIAHEIGHSLGASHDGVGNQCVQGWAMESGFMFANKYKWIFSICSVNYIKNYLYRLNWSLLKFGQNISTKIRFYAAMDLARNGTNCLRTTENHSPSPEMKNLTSQQYGEIYSADNQCKIVYGPGSYLCRHLYHDSYTYADICLRLFCYHPDNGTCFFVDAGNGTPCGDGRWCYAGECVMNGKAPSVSGTCPVGDQDGIVKNGLACSALIKSDPSQCTDKKMRYACCSSCKLNKNATLTFVANISIDDQCAAKVGVGSQMCRGGTRYDNVAYSDTVCSDMECVDIRNPTMCVSKTADDGTPCGNKKWCINGQCVVDSRSPSVSDTCPWGDAPGVVTYGLTCKELLQPEHQWRCNDKFSAKVCCATCDSLRTNIMGCPYGDKSDWCRYNIRSQYDKGKCYRGNNDDLCCGTCHKYLISHIPGCSYGDKSDWCVTHLQSSSDANVCYYGNEDLCCESCHKYKNSTNIGCEYGDKVNGCHSYDCARYPVATRQKCCKSCSSTSAVIVG